MPLPKAIICDLDGTLCDHRHRLHFVDGECAFLKFPDRYRKALWDWKSPEDGYVYYDTLTNKEFKPDYESYYAAMDKDKVNKWCKEICWNYPNLGAQALIFITGRPEKYKKTTDGWLSKHGLDYELFMRPDHLPQYIDEIINDEPFNPIGSKPPKPDHRPAHVVKREIYDREIAGKYDVLFVLDDEERCCQMYKELGLTVLKVM